MPVWALALQVAVSALTSVMPAIEAEIQSATANQKDTLPHEIAQAAVKNGLGMLNDMLAVAQKIASTVK